MSSTAWALCAAVAALAGGGVLAFSLNRVLWELGFAVDAVNKSIASLASGGDVYVFKGLDTRLKKAKATSNLWVTLGVALLLVSFACSAVSLWRAGQEQQASAVCQRCSVSQAALPIIAK